MNAHNPFCGRRAVMAMLRGNEPVAGPVLKRWLGVKVECADGVDADAFGSFNGENTRIGSMLEAAPAKALFPVNRTGATIGLGRDDVFDLHLIVPFLASGSEVFLLLAMRDEHQIFVQCRTPNNYDQVVISLGEKLAGFLSRVGFPTHAAAIRLEQTDNHFCVEKGVVDLRMFENVVVSMASRSKTGLALIQTELPAYAHSTRRKTITFMVKALAIRAAKLFCIFETPGFWIIEVVRGLPCAHCGAPSQVITGEIHGCIRAG